ncbi:MAG: hypothetical protein U1C74_16805, partial [Phenylobacterium sp.]|nr:hypothetical protein [Phenylobacterium sp.]
RMASIIKGIRDRLKEPSSWAAIAMALGFFGVKILPELWEGIVMFATGGAIILAFYLKEKPKA